MNPTLNSNQPRGLPCPNCNNLIQFRIEDLLRQAAFRCQICGLQIRISRQQSREALRALEKLQGAIETLNTFKDKYSGKRDG